MKCEKCNKDFSEKEMEESHDVPCYLFIGLNRKASKQLADKFPRHWICKSCHKKYENNLNFKLKLIAIEFSKE
ncbi:MAG: hypothetical protein AABY22_08860, partial [Nanoarchaeota archaeon]